jgi:hypothetical protein
MTLQTATTSPCQRSRVANRPATLPGLDGRSAEARRFREMVTALTDQLGGALGEAETLQVRAAASLQLHAEDLSARSLRGEAIDSEQLTRAANGAIRAMAALRARLPAKGGQGEGRAYLAAKRAAASPQAVAA